jgi:adenylate kinase
MEQARVSAIVILGPPGIGKGTQATSLSRALGVPHVNTGELFRGHVARKTELGLRVAKTLDSGGYVSDELTTAMLRERIELPDAAHGFILDGYPRTIPQVLALDSLLNEQGLSLERVLLLVCDIDMILERLRGREQKGRLDDHPDVVRVRLSIYGKESEPISQSYAGRGLLERVDASLSIDQVASAVADLFATQSRFSLTQERGSRR